MDKPASGGRIGSLVVSSLIRHGALVDLAVEDGSIGVEFWSSRSADSTYSLDVGQFGRRRRVPEPVRFYGFPEAVTSLQDMGFLADLASELESQCGRLYYLGPLRGYPERSYLWSGDEPDHVGQHGERAVAALLAAEERRRSRGKQRHTMLQDCGLSVSKHIRCFEVRQLPSATRSSSR